MDPVAQTPTEPADYAALSAGYGALVGALLLAARHREGEQPLSASELVPLGLASFALSKLVTKEKAESWIRGPFVDERPGAPPRPKGRRLRYAMGELLTCPRCAGAWSSLGLVALRVARPREARVLASVLGVSAVNDFLHSAFSLLCASANTQQAVAEPPRWEAADGGRTPAQAPSR